MILETILERTDDLMTVSIAQYEKLRATELQTALKQHATEGPMDLPHIPRMKFLNKMCYPNSQ
jgi:hypothetical protein